jgi:hypothetical protein
MTLNWPAQTRTGYAEMTSREDIEGAIRDGMREACADSLVFSEDETRQIDAEYLLTVNVAKSVAKLNTDFGDPYRIFVERQTRTFCDDCIPLIKRSPAANLIGRTEILRKPGFNVRRNGRIDICVYRRVSGLDDVPVCAIELKKFGCASQPAIDDLIRNAEYFCLSGPTGDSRIDFTVFGALESFPKSLTAEDFKRDLVELEEFYTGLLTNLKPSPSFSVTVDPFTVRSGLEVTDCDDGEKILESNHHFAGILVTFARQPKPRADRVADFVKPLPP